MIGYRHIVLFNVTMFTHICLLGQGSKSWFISDLPDPDGCYAGLLAEHGQILDNVRVTSPDVRAANGVFIHAGKYAAHLNDGDIVEVEVNLKL